ncbi:MAG: metal-binding protein [Oceanospirillaceae bacterium]|nr:metal-binding protein [Oceanospirillaceae bacterium]
MSFVSTTTKTLLLLGVPAILAACSESSATDSKVSGTAAKAADIVELDVYKSPTCGCCTSWIEHADKHGFASTVHHPDDLNAVKDQYGVAARLRSCHTAVSEAGYVFEGHVPAKLVTQFLNNPPAGAIGLSVPGMPAGSPGMEMGDRFDPYPVVLMNKDGTFSLYQEIKQQEEQY